VEFAWFPCPTAASKSLVIPLASCWSNPFKSSSELTDVFPVPVCPTWMPVMVWLLCASTPGVLDDAPCPTAASKSFVMLSASRCTNELGLVPVVVLDPSVPVWFV
jgi:hypothetical protein